MALKSMTGFARAAGSTGAHGWSWELKSVNGRGLEIRVRTPPGFDEVGEAARKLAAAAFSRGQCQLTLTVTRAAGPVRTRINRDLLLSLVAALSDLPVSDAVAPPRLDGLLSVRGVVEVDEDGAGDPDAATLRQDLLAGARRLVADLDEARAEEGRALSTVIAAQLDRMAALVADAEACPARSPEAIRARLAAQVAALLDASGAALEPARLHAEAALLATRSDIREELDRLGAHLAAARDLLAAEGPVGRKLDFLAQEFGREANTLCAKAGDVSLSRIGLDLKAVVEQFREQVQNVE